MSLQQYEGIVRQEEALLSDPLKHQVCAMLSLHTHVFVCLIVVECAHVRRLEEAIPADQ